MKHLPLLVSTLFITACASTPAKPPAPEWTKQSTRLVDNGYIVYVGHAEAATLENAQFKAEGIALEDLANECSYLPKGIRIEDRFNEPIQTGHSAFIKIAVEFQDCDHASKTNDPVEIKKNANVAFTSQLKKYQDLNETGDFPATSEVAVIEVPKAIASAPVQGQSTDQMHFYVTRQYIAYQKEVVVLSPLNAFAAGSPETQKFNNAIAPAHARVEEMIQKDQSLKSHPQVWSHLHDRPLVTRPAVLQSHPLAPPAGPRARSVKSPPRPRKREFREPFPPPRRYPHRNHK